MKKYKNKMASTEFTGKQVSFIYRGAKEGHIRVPAWVMVALYDLAGFYGYPNKNIEYAEELAMEAIQSAIRKEWEWAQDHIDEFAEVFIQTGIKRNSYDMRFVHSESEPWDSDILEDLFEGDG